MLDSGTSEVYLLDVERGKPLLISLTLQQIASTCKLCHMFSMFIYFHTKLECDLLQNQNFMVSIFASGSLLAKNALIPHEIYQPLYRKSGNFRR